MKIVLFLIVSFLAWQVHAQDTIVTSISTKAHLEFVRDVKLPIKQDRLTTKIAFFKTMIGPNIHVFQDSLLKMEEELEGTTSILNILKDSIQMAERTSLEMELKWQVMNNKKLKKKYGKLWERATKLAEKQRQLEARFQFYNAGGLKILGAGISVVQACDPNESEENRTLAQQKLDYYRKAFPVRGGFDNSLYRGFFADHLNRAHNWLDENDPYLTKVFMGQNGDEFLAEVYRDGQDLPYISFVGYSEKRDSLVSLGWDAVKNSKDPVIVAARELIILMRESKKLQEKLTAEDAGIRSEMERAFFEVYGRRVKIINDNFYYDFDLDRYYDMTKFNN